MLQSKKTFAVEAADVVVFVDEFDDLAADVDVDTDVDVVDVDVAMSLYSKK